tara:strand:+ start:1138 stop:1311 length:174 start_codon:yes stop_codon:yes gene_type:complete
MYEVLEHWKQCKFNQSNDAETREDEWNYLNNEKTIKELQEFDKWLEELSKKNGETKY